jgi:hypothetical protein
VNPSERLLQVRDFAVLESRFHTLVELDPLVPASIVLAGLPKGGIYVVRGHAQLDFLSTAKRGLPLV